MPDKKAGAAAKRWDDIILQQHDTYFTMRLPDRDAGILRHFPLAPGIYLSFVYIHTNLWPVPQQEDSNHVLLLNYCRNGRCEVALNNEKYAYLSDGQFALALQQLAKPCLYPNSFYEGIEVFLDLDILRETPYPMFAELGIDLFDLCERFRLSDSFCLLPLPESMADILACLWKLDSAADSPGAGDICDTMDISDAGNSCCPADLSAMKLLLTDFIFLLSRQNRPKSPQKTEMETEKKIRNLGTEENPKFNNKLLTFFSVPKFLIFRTVP